MSFICYWSDMKCDGCGDKHKDCHIHDGYMKRQEIEAEKARQEEAERMKCGKCDKCKVQGVKLNAVMGHIWDLCDGCFKEYTKPKKSKK